MNIRQCTLQLVLIFTVLISHGSVFAEISALPYTDDFSTDPRDNPDYTVNKGSNLSISMVGDVLYVDGTGSGNFGVLADFGGFFGGTLQKNFQVFASFDNAGGSSVQGRLFALATDGSGDTGYALLGLGNMLRIMKNGNEALRVDIANSSAPYVLTFAGVYNADGSLTLTGKKELEDGAVETISWTDTGALSGDAWRMPMELSSVMSLPFRGFRS
jgi:hypothetical protein